MNDSSGTSLPASEPPQQESNKLLLHDTAYCYEDESNTDLKKKKRLLRELGNRGRLSFLRFLFRTLRRPLRNAGKWLSDSPFHDFFLGDKDLDESLTQMGWLKDRDVTVIPDFLHHGGKGENDIVASYKETYSSFEFAADHRNLIPFVLLKTKLLVDDTDLIKFATQPESLSEEEHEEIERFHSRFISLCRLAYDLDLSVIIAEDHYLCQSVVDKYTDEVMQLFNKHKPVIFASLNCYQPDRFARLQEIATLAEKSDLYAGITLTDGLYREEERAYAQRNGYPTLPLVSQKEESSQFQKATEFIFERLERLSLCAVTHHPSQCQYLLDLMQRKGIELDDSKVNFAQNMGMADTLTYALSRMGCNVSKVLPYGNPVEALYLLLGRYHANTLCRQLAQQEEKSITKEEARRRKDS